MLGGVSSIIAAALNLDPENSSCLKQVKILQKCAINTLVSTYNIATHTYLLLYLEKVYSQTEMSTFKYIAVLFGN